MANKIHLNVATVVPQLKQLEIGLCGAEVTNPQIAYLWNEMPMGFWHDDQLDQIRNVCKKCIRMVREQTPERVQIFGFHTGEPKEIIGESL